MMFVSESETAFDILMRWRYDEVRNLYLNSIII